MQAGGRKQLTDWKTINVNAILPTAIDLMQSDDFFVEPIIVLKLLWKFKTSQIASNLGEGEQIQRPHLLISNLLQQYGIYLKVTNTT